MAQTPIRFSRHASTTLEQRKLDPVWVEAAIRSPDRIGPDPSDPALTRSYKLMPDRGGRTLRVVHRRDGDHILVITAFFDRGARA